MTGLEGKSVHSWFNFYTWNTEYASLEDFYANYNQDDIDRTVALVSKLIEEEAKLLGSTTKVFIGGHS